MALPKIIQNFNLFIEGRGFAGVAKQITLPKLARKMEEYRGGGMEIPLEIDMGGEKLETEINLGEFSRPVLDEYGVCDVAGVKMRFRGAQKRDDADCKVDKVEIVMQGRFAEMDFGDIEPGKPNELKLKGALAYYRYSLNDEDLIEIDVLNMIFKVNGVDRLAQQRKALDI